MNLLCTSAGARSFEFEDEIAQWKGEGQIIELLPFERVAAYLHFAPAARLALIDAIVCATDPILFHWGPSNELEVNSEITQALKLAADVHNLPGSCAMRDGRKWNAIPFVIVSGSGAVTPEMRQDTHAHIIERRTSYPTLILRQIRDIVNEYHDRVLDDYRKVGIIVRFEHGRAQIRPALRRRHPELETEYYYAAADRRYNTGWVTVKRDIDGIRFDVEFLQALIDRRATEREMHQFFEEHPAILMEARLGIPISHRPNFAMPRDWKPDFAFSPILGPRLAARIELMELKGPGERMLSGGIHRGFSAKVYHAIEQVRDYDRCLRNPVNLKAIQRAFGYVPHGSKLAVLIGRTPPNEADREAMGRRRSELNVEVITYDEILQTQATQIERYPSSLDLIQTEDWTPLT